MTLRRRQPKGVPIGGQFAESAHEEASGALGGGEIEIVPASSVRPGDIVVTEDRSGKEVRNVVTSVNPTISFSGPQQTRLTFEGDENRVLGEGARVSASSSPMRVIQSAEAHAAPSARELAAVLRAHRRIGADEDISNPEEVIQAALGRNADIMVATAAKGIADRWEARNYHEGATRLRAAAERVRLASEPGSRIDDYYSLAASPDTPPELVDRAVDEGFARGAMGTTVIAVSNNPNAPRSAVERALAACDDGGGHLDWVAEKLRARP